MTSRSSATAESPLSSKGRALDDLMMFSQKQNNQYGVSIIWMMGSLMTLVLLASIAVDYGRVQLAKTELRRAADAAARAGASGLGDITIAQNLAIQYAALNKVDGTDYALSTSNIAMGNW